MRKTLFLTFMAIMIAFTTQAQTQLYEFPFNNSLSATIGTGTFASAGVSFITDRKGDANGAINLNGTGTTATLNGLPYGSAARSISLWAKVNNFNPNYNFLYSYGTSTNPDGVFIKLLEARHFVPNHSIAVNHGGTGVWFHYVITYDGTSSKIYKDGVLVSSSNITKNTINNSNLFRLGLTESGGTNYFDGAIDDLKIYSGVLTAQQVNALYLDGCKNQNPVNTTPTANLTICEGTSTTLTASGNNIYWFADTTSTTELGTGNSFTTPILNTTTQYYVQTIDSSQGCDPSDRIAITVNIIPAGILAAPEVISDTSIIYCTGATATLVASGSNNGTLQWYDAPSGGNLLATGNTFTTPTLSTDITYYVEDFNTCSSPNSSARTAVLVNVGGSFPLTNETPYHRMRVCQQSWGNATILTVSTTAETVLWSLNGNQIGTGLSITTPFFTTDTTFIVTATKQGVCTAILPIEVTVYNSLAFGPAPTNTTPANPAQLCPKTDTITLSATHTYNAPLYWYNNGQLVGVGSPITVPVAAGGTYTVRSGADACQSPATTVQFNTALVATGFITYSNDSIRANNSYESYELWKDGAVVASSNTTGSFKYPASCGQYKAYFTNTSSNCSGISIQMRKTQIPGGAGAGCFYYDIIPGGNITHPAYWSWSLNGTPGPANVLLNTTGTSSTTNWLCPTTGTLNLRFKTATGCEYLVGVNIANLTTVIYQTVSGFTVVDTISTCDFISNTITIPLAAPINTTSMSNRTICAGQTTTLTATGNGILKWYNVATGGTELGTGTSFNTGVLSSNTNFYVEAESGTCTSSRTLVAVTVNSLPQATITQNGTALSTQTFSAYQWQLNGVDISNATSQTYNAIQNGNYTVLVTGANGCQNISDSVNVTTVGIQDLQSNEVYFKIYPNPTKNLLNVEVNEIVNINIVNVLGVTIATQKLYEGNNIIDVSNLASGIYFISNERGGIARFVKE